MDIMSLWVLIKSRRETLSTIVIGIVLFGAGWQLGRVMSPYYVSHPITFNDRPCTSTAASSGGSKEELQALATEVQDKVAAVTTKKLAAPKVASTKVDTNQAAAGTPTPSSSLTGSPSASVAAATENMFAASKSSNKYHHKDCSTWKRIKPENLIWFSTREQAEAAGYQPTACGYLIHNINRMCQI
jgi:hypothetical protein